MKKHKTIFISNIILTILIYTILLFSIFGKMYLHIRLNNIFMYLTLFLFGSMVFSMIKCIKNTKKIYRYLNLVSVILLIPILLLGSLTGFTYSKTSDKSNYLRINDMDANLLFESGITIFPVKIGDKRFISDSHFDIKHYFYYSTSSDFFPDLIIDTIIKYNDEDYASEKTRLLALSLPNTINEKGFTIFYKEYFMAYSKEYGFGYNDETKEIKYYLTCFEGKRFHEDYINLINS